MSKEEKKEEKTAKPARVAAKPVRKTFKEDRKRRTTMPMKERPKERQSSTVKGIIAGIHDQRKTHDAMRTLNNAAIAKFNTGVCELYERIVNHAQAHKEMAAVFNASIREFNAGVREFDASIREQMNENMEYVKNFYG